jgi:hypothetical protein
MEEIKRICDVVAPVEFKLAYFQYEVGANGTPHLQGFILLKKPRRVTELAKRISPKIHYDAARGEPKEIWDYCHKLATRDNTKDPTSYYYPSYAICLEYSSSSKFSTKKLSFKMLINARAHNVVSSYIDDPNYVRHKRAIDEIADQQYANELLESHRDAPFIPLEWQQQCLNLLEDQTDRQVMTDDEFIELLMSFD